MRRSMMGSVALLLVVGLAVALHQRVPVPIPAEGRYAVLSADGKRLALWDLKHASDTTIDVHSPAQNAVPRRLRAPTFGKVISVALSHEGRHLAAAVERGSRGEIHYWRVDDDPHGHVIAAHGGMLYDVDVSADGRFVVSAAHDGRSDESYGGEVVITDVETGEVQWTRTPARTVVVCAFAPDESTVATADVTGAISVDEWATSTTIATFEHDERSRRDSLAGWMPLVISPGRRMLASGGGTSLVIWNITSGGELLRVEAAGPVAGVTFSESGRYVAYLVGGECVHLVDCLSWREQGTVACRSPRAIAFDGEALVYYDGRSLKTWQAE